MSVHGNHHHVRPLTLSSKYMSEYAPSVSRTMKRYESLYRGMNIYWVCSATLGLWFLFVFALPKLITTGLWRNHIMFYHVLGSYPCYLACIVNTLVTPFVLQGRATDFHKWLGRIGYLGGITGAFPYGMYYSWVKDRNHYTVITLIVGTFWFVVPGYCGYAAILEYKRLKEEIKKENDTKKLEEMKSRKDQALSCHVYSMIACMTIGCAVPGGQRMVHELWKLVDHVIPGRCLGICFAIAMIVPLCCIRPFHDCYFRDTKTVVEGNPLSNLVVLAQDFYTKFFVEREFRKINYFHFATQIVYQVFLWGNLPGRYFTPTIIDKISVKKKQT